MEVGIFGPEGTAASVVGQTSSRSGSIRRSQPSKASPSACVVSSVKDPEWEPAESAAKSKTSMGSGGEGESKEPPAPVKVPLPVQRAMAQRVQKAALPKASAACPGQD